MSKVCFAAIGACAFSGAWLRLRTFLYVNGGYMSENNQKKVIDVTGIELMPGEPSVCLGNGEQGFECCCDECDYYFVCFPEFNPKNDEALKNIEVPPPSKWLKRQMNRLFRERVGSSFLPFPEEDTIYERVRSYFVIKFKINEFSDRRKKRRRIR